MSEARLEKVRKYCDSHRFCANHYCGTICAAIVQMIDEPQPVAVAERDALRTANEALSAEVAGLRTTLREIGNRAGAPTMTYCEPIENREQRESLDWIAEKVRAAIDAARAGGKDE